MMIKSLLRLIFVLVYKSTSPWSKSKKKRNHFRGCSVLFNELFIFVVFLPRNFPVIRENGDYFTVIIGLFKLFVSLTY